MSVLEAQIDAQGGARTTGFWRLATASAVLQIRILRHSLFELFTIVLVPIQTLGFVAVFRHAGRPDLDVYGVIAPALIALWQVSLLVSGEVIARERDNQSLESLCAAPGRLSTVLLGRVSVVTLVSLLGLVLSALTGWLAFGIKPMVGNPLVFVIALLCTAVATTATALLFSVFFVNSRSPRIFQNGSTFPFYVLGGVLVPVTLFPHWIQPLSRVVFLSWSADLFRDSVHSVAVPGWAWRCAVVLGLAAVGYLLAKWTLTLTLRNARQEANLASLPDAGSGTASRAGTTSQPAIFRAAIRTGVADFRLRYTWKTWAFGWLLRCLLEVTFYGLIGVLLNSREAGLYLLVGRGFYLGTQEVMWVIQSSAWERGTGTLPLLVSAPGRVWPVFAGRSTQWLPSAMATSTIALFTVGPAFGLRYNVSGAMSVLLAVPVGVITSYCFALPVAALVLRRPAWRNLASNVTHGVMGLVCGAFVPVAFWPGWVQWFAQIFPVTHSLNGLRRGLASDGSVAAALPGLAVAIGVSLFWLVLGAILLERFAEGARRDGSIDLDS